MTEVNASSGSAGAEFSCLYFGFASNLSPRTLQQRCPGSLYVGLATLQGWKFIVSETGFGNIVRATEEDYVYGSLSFLTAQHEAALDKSEEIDWWHKKMKVQVTMVPQQGSDHEWRSGRAVEATTYIDVERTTEGNISKEYIIWMRKAIADGIECGVPTSYIEKYMQRFLPSDSSVGHEDKIMMLRTAEVDRNDFRFVPKEMLDATSKQ